MTTPTPTPTPNPKSKELPTEFRQMVTGAEAVEKLAEAWKKNPFVAKLWANEFKRKGAGCYVLDPVAVAAVMKAVDTADKATR